MPRRRELAWSGGAPDEDNTSSAGSRRARRRTAGTRRTTIEHAVPTAVAVRTRRWAAVQPAALDATGALFTVALSGGAGVLIAGVADRQARLGGPGAEVLFWIALLAIFVPAAVRILRPGTPRAERLGAGLVVGLGVYLVKVMDGGGTFLFGDELIHWRTAADMLATGQLFGPNPLSVVSPSYPGLELVTSALASIGGTSIQTAGLVVIAVARIVLVLGLFRFVESLTGSDRLAGIATLVYAANPNFVFWSSQFAYESLALPLAVLALHLAVRQGRATTVARRPFEVASIVVILAIVVTHHLTAYGLLVLFTAWAITSVLRRRVGADRTPAPLLIAAVTAVATVAWLVVTLRQTLGYLVPALVIAGVNVVRVFTGQRSVKTLFAGDPSLVAPPLERAIAFAAVGLMAVALVVGVLTIWPRLRWFPRRTPASLLPVLAVASLAYLPLQGLRLVQGTTELANRSADFLFVPGAVMAAFAAAMLWRRARRFPAMPILVGLLTVLFAGGVIIGTPLWARLPGPYAVTNDTRAIDPETIAMADWLGARFGPSNAVIGNQSATVVLGSYGGQRPVFGASWVFFTAGFGPPELQAIQATGARFIVVDRRITTALPLNGFYFENREPVANRHTSPLPAAELDKLDGAPSLRRIYDSGDFTIYELVASGAQ